MPTVIAGGETMCTPPLVTSAHLACMHPANPNISKHPMFHSISSPSPGKQHLLMHIAPQARTLPMQGWFCSVARTCNATNCWSLCRLCQSNQGNSPINIKCRPEHAPRIPLTPD